MAGFNSLIHVVGTRRTQYRNPWRHDLSPLPASSHIPPTRTKPHTKMRRGPWCCIDGFINLNIETAEHIGASGSTIYLWTVFDLPCSAVRTKWRLCPRIISAGMKLRSKNGIETNGCRMSSIFEQSRHSFHLLRPLDSIEEWWTKQFHHMKVQHLMTSRNQMLLADSDDKLEALITLVI